jgi:hypothetical protein
MGALLDMALAADTRAPLASSSVSDLVPLSATQERARQEVLARLEAHPAVRRALVTRFEAGNLIVTLAIRGIGTGELLIPADRFNQRSLTDYDALLKCLKTEADS